MNRVEFMESLTTLLQDVSEAEREEAIQYYNDYFDDAGDENEEEVIAALGTPDELAKSIRAGLSDNGQNGEFTENGYLNSDSKKNEMMKADAMGESEQGANDYYQKGYYQRTGGQGIYGGRGDYRGQEDPYGNSEEGYTDKTLGTTGSGTSANSGKPAWVIALVALALIITSPIWVGVAGALFGIICGIFGILFGIVLAFIFGGLALLVAGIAILIFGIITVSSQPLAGLCVIGASFVTTAIGILLIWLFAVVVFLALPALVRSIIKVFQKRPKKGGARA